MNPLIKNEEPQWIELGGGQRRKIRAYNENAMLVEVGFDTGAVGAAHSPSAHADFLRAGRRIYLYHRGNTRTKKKGDSIVVDGGKVHGCTCVKAGTLLDIFTPMREDFVK